MFATRKRLLTLKAAVVFLAASGLVVLAVHELHEPYVDGRWSFPNVECENLADNFTMQTVGELPEPVESLVCERTSSPNHLLFVGTRGNGGVYRLKPRSPYSVSPIITATGEAPVFGTSEVSVLALMEQSRDGKDELVALSSQETPRGKPRAYILGVDGPGQDMTVVDIASSWPHGIAFLKDVFGRPMFLSAYCGYGEIVEFRPFDRKGPTGFHAHGLESKVLGMVPASGEQIASADLVGDGTHVLIARGFRLNHAGIEIYARDRITPAARAKETVLGVGWLRRWELREADRFGNVRFLIGGLRNGVRDLYAWWCAGLADGETEFVHYRLSASGTIERRSLALGQAADCWPEDNRMVLADADGDGVEEIYFSSRSGRLWRLDVHDPETNGETAAASRVPVLIGYFPVGGGPIIASPVLNEVRSLYLGVGNHVVKLTPRKATRTAAVAKVETVHP